MKKLFEIAAEIVHAQASIGHMSPDQIEMTLMKTFSTLQRMQKAEEERTVLDLIRLSGGITPSGETLETISPEESIQEDKVICLECGAGMKQLTSKHLSSHNMDIREYKKKWGFPLKQSLSARVLSRARSRAAKQRGLPENLLKYQEGRKQEKIGPFPSEILPR